MSVFSVNWQLSQAWMANFPAFIAPNILTYKTLMVPQIKSKVLRHIMKLYLHVYFEKDFLSKPDWSFTEKYVIKSSHRHPVKLVENWPI